MDKPLAGAGGRASEGRWTGAGVIAQLGSVNEFRFCECGDARLRLPKDGTYQMVALRDREKSRGLNAVRFPHINAFPLLCDRAST